MCGFEKLPKSGILTNFFFFSGWRVGSYGSTQKQFCSRTILVNITCLFWFLYWMENWFLYWMEKVFKQNVEIQHMTKCSVHTTKTDYKVYIVDLLKSLIFSYILLDNCYIIIIIIILKQFIISKLQMLVFFCVNYNCSLSFVVYTNICYKIWGLLCHPSL